MADVPPDPDGPPRQFYVPAPSASPRPVVAPRPPAWPDGPPPAPPGSAPREEPAVAPAVTPATPAPDPPPVAAAPDPPRAVPAPRKVTTRAAPPPAAARASGKGDRNGQAGTAPASRKGCRPRLRPRRLLLLVVLVLAGLLVLGAVSLVRSFGAVDRVDLSGVLDPVRGDSVNYLLVGSDSREGLDPDVQVGAPPSVTGRRSDTIIVLRVTPGGTAMMSIPRDLVVVDAATGRKGRINGAYNRGPANLVRTVQRNLGLPVNHYMEVGFGSFAGVVDAVGGVTIDVPHPAFDDRSGLRIEQAGRVTLDGRQALAYVRSRHYTEVVDGRPRTDPTADLGRQQRQQQFLRTALGEVGATKNPVALVRAASALGGGLTVDTGFGPLDALRLGRRMSGSDPLSVVLPTSPARLGSAQVLVLRQPAADRVLASFR